MNMEGLRLFCSVVDEGSISQAARLSYVSQPAVTRQIKQLEELYKTELFIRHNGKLLLTEAGKVLYPYAKEIIHYAKQSVEAVQEQLDATDTILRIGASATIGEYLLPRLLGEFMKTHADLRFSISVANTPTILTQLDNNKLDIAFVEGLTDVEEDLVKEMFFQDELVLVISPNHRWSNRDSVHVKELEEEKIIWREEESGTRSIMKKALEEHHVLDRLTSILELGSYQSIKSAVEAQLGISILPRLVIQKELQFGTLQTMEVEGLHITRDLYMIQKNQRFTKSSTEKLVTFINEISSELPKRVF